MMVVYLLVCGLPVTAGFLLCLCGHCAAGLSLIAGGYSLMALGVWRMWRR